MKLTESTVSKSTRLLQGKNEAIIFDDHIPGFGLRVRSGGACRWVFQYKLGSKHRRMTFGRYPALHSAEARKIAARLHADVRLGNDPAGAKANKQARAAETFGAVMKTYLAARRGTVRASTYGEIERHLSRNLAPLHGMHIAKVDLRAVATQLARLTKECGPAQANRTRASLSKFLNWCAGEGLVETNAAAFANQNKEMPRDRVLSNSELLTIWRALPDNDYGAIVRLLILSGQRANEIALLRWSEIHFDRGIVFLPAGRTKNRRAHIVPMAPAVRSILEAQPRRAGRDFVFGTGQGGFSGWSRCKTRLDAATKLPPFVIHDIRRSVSTGMAEMGIAPHIVESVLNHVSGHKAGVAGRYNYASYEGEKAVALQRWADHVTAIVEERDMGRPEEFMASRSAPGKNCRCHYDAQSANGWPQH